MRTRFTIEYSNAWPNRPVHVHFIRMPTPGEAGFYRATMTTNAFFYSTSLRNKKATCFIGLRELNEYPENTLDKVPQTTHASIWEFYTAVGYNYKKKKFVENEDAQRNT